MTRTVRIAATLAVCTLVGSSAAYAQAPRTWVSGVGDDVNPCSRTAPCKTFAGAISKTAAGGEISVLDPGGYGAVTITKSITINGEGTLAGISFSGGSGIIVNALATDVVTLRNISILGTAANVSGIRLLSAALVNIDKVNITGATTNGIDVEPSGSMRVVISDTTIRGGQNGIQVTGGGNVSVDRTSIRGASNAGIDASGGSVNVNRSVFMANTFIAFFGQVGNHTLNDSLLSGNFIAVQATTGASVAVSNNSIVGNSFAYGCGGGAIPSTGNNRNVNNPSGGCAPTTSITVQ
jgi:hypothetical protein